MSCLTHLGAGVFQWVLQTTWQAAALAGLILLAQRLLRNRLSPSWRYGLWLLLVVRLLMPAPPPSAFSIFNLAGTAPAAIGANKSGGTLSRIHIVSAEGMRNSISEPFPPDVRFVPEPPFDAPPLRPLPVVAGHAWKMDWFGVALCGWLAGVCFFAARLVWTNGRFRSRIGGYQPIADENVTRLFNDCRAAFKITRPVRLIESEEVESPAVYGLCRKWLLLPDGVFERFSTDELRSIFLHELAHIKRGDLAVNWLVALLQVVHWFNPILGLAWVRMRADRELAADALALAHVAESDHAPYGETILKVLEGLTGERALPGLVGIVESKAQLKERLRAISRDGEVKHWRWAAIGIAAIVAGVGLTDARQIHQPDAAGKQEAPAIPRDYAPQISGRVVDPAGRPVAGAQLALFKPKSELCLTGEPQLFNPSSGHVMGEPRLENLPWNYCTTDAKGRFLLNDLAEALFLLAVQQRGFARIATNEFSTNMTVKLEPWGRIEGTLWHYDEVVANEPVSAKIAYYDGAAWSTQTEFKANTDGHGRFSFEFVLPGKFAVFGSGIRELAVVKSGETTVLKIGGSGRPVIGKFKIRNPNVETEWGGTVRFCIISTPPGPSEPFKTKEDYEAWRHQPEVEHLRGHNSHAYTVRCAKDGSFRFDQVVPGKYEMVVDIRDPRHPILYSTSNFIAGHDGYDGTFEIPDTKPNTREPLDLGVIEISLEP